MNYMSGGAQPKNQRSGGSERIKSKVVLVGAALRR